jgi:hypothetical protein
LEKAKSILKNANKNKNMERENVKKQGPRFAQESLASKVQRDSLAQDILASAKKSANSEEEAQNEQNNNIGSFKNIKPLNEKKLQYLLSLQKDELFDLDSESLKQYVNHLGYDQFVGMYGLNKFELCALDKNCDSFIGYAESKQTLERLQQLQK